MTSMGIKDLAMSVADQLLADHCLISKGYGKMRSLFSAAQAEKVHRRSKDWLVREHKTIVVTHHASNAESVDRRFRNDPLTPAFVSDLSEILKVHCIDLWVHGHMHNTSD